VNLVQRGKISFGILHFLLSKFNLIALEKDGGYLAVEEGIKERPKMRERKLNRRV